MIKERLANINEELRRTVFQLHQEAAVEIEELTIQDIRQHYSNLSRLNSTLENLLIEYQITERDYANS